MLLPRFLFRWPEIYILEILFSFIVYQDLSGEELLRNGNFIYVFGQSMNSVDRIHDCK